VLGPARKRGPKGRSAGPGTPADPVATVTIRSAAPLTDPRLALELARTHLERQTLSAPIQRIVLTTLSQAPRADPNEPLFPEPRRDQAAHDIAITRLTSRFGADRVTRASRVELASPRARAAWTGADATPGAARPWRQQDPPSPVRDAHVEVAGRRRRVVRVGRIERALAPFWLTGALRVERLAWAEVDGPLLVMLRARRAARWEAVAWVD